MDGDLRRRLEEVFLEIVDLDEPLQQRRLASEPPEVVEALRHGLEAYRRAGPLLEEGALAAIPDLEQRWTTATPGRRIGPYRVISELGRGGMGAVFLAQRDDPSFPQQVAVKLIKKGMDSEQIVRRFITERRILADLIHPNIARLLDGGSTDDGRPYFVLEHVVGRPITTEVKARRLDIDGRLQLFLKVCSAVQYAHQKLIVHRDLKPANILVDAEGEPKLLDFGIAKLLDPDEISPTLTGGGSPLTPDYASPEQSSGEPVTTASDVYSLGVLLFELLTGTNPQNLPEGRSASKSVALDLDSAAARRRWSRRLAGDLDTILAKALEADPRRRYGTAAALAEDLERHLESRPVTARRPTRLYRWGRTVLRHRWATAALTTVVLLSGAAVLQSFELSRQQYRLAQQHRRTEALADFLKGLFSASDPGQSRGASMTAREILDLGARRLSSSTGSPAATEPETRASLLKEIGDVYTSLGLYEEGRQMLELAREILCPNEPSLDCVEVWISLGRTLASQGQYEEAERFLRRASGTHLNSGVPTTLRIEMLSLQGLVAVETGRFDSADRFFDQALNTCRTHPDTPAPLTAETLRSVANLEAERGALELASEHLEESVALFRSALGADHPHTLRAWNDLATVVYQRGDHPEAERLFRAILDARRSLLGPDHPEVAQAMNNLAVVQQALGRLQDAEASLRQVLILRQGSSTTSTLGMAQSLNSLAAVLRKQHRFEEASELYKRAAETLQASGADAHPELANIYKGWALAEQRLGRADRAEALARSGLDLARQTFGEPHYAVADAWRWIADIAAGDDRFDDAEPAYRNAIALADRLPAEERAGLAGAWVGLGSALMELDRAQEALTWLEQGVDLRSSVLPEDDWRLAAARARLGRCLLLLGRSAEARPLLETAHGILLNRLGPESRETRAAGATLSELDSKIRQDKN